MKNRGFIYLITLMAVISMMAAIQKMMPHKEPEKPIDKIGMKLYRPIFFASEKEMAVAQQKVQMADSFKDEPIGEPEVLEAAPTITEEKPKTAKPKTTPTTIESKNDYLTGLIENYKATVLTQRKYRNDVVVRYYKHAPDGDKADVLVEYGFYLHVREVSNPEHYQSHTSNVIYFGRDFPESDLKLIAALLVDSGLPIKLLQPFKDYNGWKRKSVEIGSSTKLTKHPELTMDDIRVFKKPE